MSKSSSITLRVFLAVVLVLWVLALIGGTAYLFYNGHKLFGVAVLGVCLVLIPRVILGSKVVIGSYIVESCKKIDDARKVEDLTDIINAAEKNGAIKNVVVYRDKLQKNRQRPRLLLPKLKFSETPTPTNTSGLRFITP